MERAFTVIHDPPWLVARFAEPQRVISWSLNRPGVQVVDKVAWLQVSNVDLSIDLDPRDYLGQRLSAAGLSDAVGLLTARSLESARRTGQEVAGTVADCLVTLGLSNAERVGSRRRAESDHRASGTINVLCHVSEPLSEAALLEALSVVTQARTTALLERDYRPDPSLGAITGTGTDCIALACPSGDRPSDYAGLHTPVGEAIGAAVLAATDLAMEDYLREKGVSPLS